MTSEYEIFGVDSSCPTIVDSPLATSPAAVLDQTIDRDLAMLGMLTLRCCECTRHGSAKDGGFQIHPGLKVYCEKCVNAEAG